MKPRLGSIQFINSLPVDWAMLKGNVPVDAEIVQGTPAELNRSLIKGDLDISPISAFCYGQNQNDLLLLPDLSISSESAVKSVLLFSRFPLDELKDKTIAITEQGRTTPALLEIILRLRYRFLPKFRPDETNKSLREVLSGQSDAALLIGDDALSAADKFKDKGLHVIDLAEEWRDWTNCPVVFAVWAVRRNFYDKNPEKVQAIHTAILKSKEWGMANLPEILTVATERTKLRREDLEDYFTKLSYDFDEDSEAGAKLYFNYATKCGLLPPVGVFHDIYDKKKFTTLSSHS